MLLPDSKQKEYEQNAHTPFVFRQVKSALWKAPLGVLFCLANNYNFDTKLTENKGDNLHLPYCQYLPLW